MTTRQLFDYVNFRLVAKACAELIRDTGGEPISIGISRRLGRREIIARTDGRVRVVAGRLPVKKLKGRIIQSTW